MMRTALSWSTFPVLMAASTVGTLVMLDQGVPASVALVIVSVVFGLTVIALEYIIPFEPAWSRPRANIRRL